MKTPPFRYGGAAALVALLGEHLREFLETWRRAEALEVVLPPSSDPDDATRERLLIHVLRSASLELIWVCEQLGFPAPDLDREPPSAERAEAYLEMVLEAWETSMGELSEEAAYSKSYPAPWGSLYCIDAMLEHAVMHPIRHSYQLRKLIAETEARADAPQ